MASAKTINELREAGVDDALGLYGPTAYVVALADLCGWYADQGAESLGVASSDWMRASKLLAGLSHRFPAQLGGKRTEAERREVQALISHGVEHVGLLLVVEATADSCEETAFALDADARDGRTGRDRELRKEADEWGRSVKLFQWAADRLGEMGF